ncbi:histidinol dehydrogenase [Yeosuana sp. MJ-SS3]|jgi:histidinol dehydrogenase|uniref:Histidinol dehydrogenase n=1 Tax=Gilvirhabdus luticola TaxID=3079858 RepID=A0ABU3U9M4_9FLAO|nr:histidinol dehydrogenase [Yeosuana sp. MJ-SS3]MDU8887108.1 histidinol dehydrogenase [Yeosuana sp. MJ-SS3]
MTTIENPNKKDWSTILKRPTQTVDDIESTVNQVFNDVKLYGDEAIEKYTLKFDNVVLESLLVSKTEIEKASIKVSEDLKQAIQTAKLNIDKFHRAQKTDRVEVETIKGVICWQEKRPIEKIGLYIPGGTAPLFSTVLMLAIPAQIAGCKEIVLCSPPNKEGKIANEILYTAQLCGVTKIIKVGGIQVIAGLTFGTATIPQVYKIFGPGNQFVTVAKQLATKYGVAIDMPAGPSELLVIADDSANAAYVASDLLSQAEHGTDSQVILVSTSKSLIANVSKEIDNQLNELPRKEIAQKSIANSKLIFVESDKIALELINEYAPEHFIICSKNEELYIKGIVNAGSVFIGNYTPESAGDYASGTNHTLPTNGFCKAYSGVNLDSFTKSITFQKISKEGLQNIGNAIELMAEAEGLQAHKNAVSMRLKDIKQK